ncbi:glycoside hydrolase family 2 TIM barrel-domain containing protein [Balneolales bacterium ANBcel1]|nr:glycoside hydrolase family 2 TIM barrel-domain containing protein [Balneolales bacterium ANBcel1]
MLFNDGWEFARNIDPELNGEFFRTSGATFDGWEQVRLPHTAHVEPLVIEDQQWQGTAVYRKAFHADEAYDGRKVTMRFEAAMHEAEVYLNGEHIHTNYGGYLPFVIDLSDKLAYGEENVILLTLNNEDNPQIPPGKPIAELDFNWFGGIYRNVYLEVKDPLHISDEILADRPAAGGVYVWYENVTHDRAEVHIRTDIQNDDAEAREATVRYILRGADGERVTSGELPAQTVDAGSYTLFEGMLEVNGPELWSPDNPYLYTLSVQLLEGGTPVDTEELRIGIRTFSIDGENGFVLNGEPLYLRGTNRHQEYPYVGYALSDNAQYRDAIKIREAGFNFIRGGHYPPSPAFMEAMDELGLLYMNNIPGWQFFGDEVFQENAYQDIRDMIRRDRNHPSVVIWEASLNETAVPEWFMDRSQEIVEEELPHGDVYTAGWIDYAFDIFIPARQHASPPEYWSGYGTEKPLFIAEYGDWEYYAHNAGFNQDAFEDLQDEERNSRQLRGFGQRRLAQQALNFQEAHNSNLYSPAFGDANWVMYDYNRGYADDLEASGIRDIFRIPKFTFYFYQSQADPDFSPDAGFDRPMAYIANWWDGSDDYTEVKVYSNADEVALFLNGEQIERRRPDQDRVSTNLNHPPFTFELDEFVPGVLRAEAYIDGEKVAEHERVTPSDPVALELSADLSGRPLEAGVNDLIFVYASVVDADGHTVFAAEPEIRFTVDGDADLIGHNPIAAEAGIATVLLRAGSSTGEVTVTATGDQLETARLTLSVE